MQILGTFEPATGTFVGMLYRHPPFGSLVRLPLLE